MDKQYDIVIVGGGPAGLTAALYGQRNGKTTLTIEKSVFGGQIANSPKVENIPGFKSISGDEFGDLLLAQVQAQGGEVMFDEVTKVESNGNEAITYTDMGEQIHSKTVVLATGTKHRVLGLPNEENYIGKQIHFCAVCDGNFYKGKKVVMIGGGNSAFVEANLLADIASELVMLQDMPFFTAETKLQEQLLSRNNVEAHVNTKILEYLIDNNKLIGIRYSENGIEKTIACDGVFLAVGLIPDNKAFVNVVDIDDKGYFNAGETTITKTNNVFVAGDCRAKSLRQVATACSDGANAAIKACEFIRKNIKD